MGVIIGRESEQRALRDLLDDVRTSTARALTVVGEPGIGKSALLDWAASSANDMLVLRGRGDEADQAVGYLVLRQLLRPLLADQALLDRLDQPMAEALVAATGLHSPGTESLASVAALELVSQASEVRPVLIVVDDVHHCDLPSLHVVAFIARRALAERVGIVLGTRPVDGHTAEAVNGLDRMDLAGLDERASRRVAEASGRRFSSDLFVSSAGNPLALQHLDPASASGGLPDRLLDGFRHALRALPAKTVTSLGVVALAGSLSDEVRDGALAAVGCTRDDLRPARPVGLLDEQFMFVHPLMRAAAVPVEPQSFAVHAALAEALSDDAPVTALHHRLRSIRGTDDQAAEEGRRVAEDMVIAGRVDEAIMLFEAAANVESERSSRSALHRRAGLMLALSSRYQASLGHFDVAISLAKDASSRAVIRRSHAWAQMWSGRPLSEAARALADDLRAALRASPPMEPEESARAWGSLIALYVQHDIFKALGAAAEAPAHPLLDIDVLLAKVLANDSDAGSRLDEFAARSISRAGMSESGFDVTDGIFCEMLLLRGRWREADDWSQRYFDLVKALQVESEFGPALSRLMATRLFMDDGVGAYGLALTAIERQPDDLAVLSAAAWIGAVVGAASAAQWATTCLQRTEALELSWFGIEAHHRLGLIAMSVDDVDTALPHFDASWGLMTDRGYRCPSICHARGDIGEAFARVGRVADSRQVIAELELGPVDSPWSSGVAARIRGMLGEPGQFERSLELLADTAWERARTDLAWARWSVAHDSERASERAERAARGFDRVGARPWAALARRVDTSSTAVTTATDRLAGLSERERTVALAVARGLSNKEVAGELYISLKTVDAHLQQIYRKLSVRSRGQLTALCVAVANA